MSINEKNLDKILRNRVSLSLREKTLQKEILGKISKHKIKIKKLLATKTSSSAMLIAMRKEIRKLFKDLYGIVLTDAKRIQFIQETFYTGLINESLARVYKARKAKGLKSVADIIINSNGTFAHQTTSINTKQLKRIESVVKTGLTSQMPYNKMVSELMRTYIVPQHQIKTLVRTTITEISSDVANKVYDANKDVISHYEYVATLDSRTSIICGRLDGKRYSVDSTNTPHPPLHYNCRSTTVPIIKSANQLDATKSNRISKRKLKKITPARRATINGESPAKVKFPDFLKRQDNDFKLNVLGSQKRVDIFNQGKLKLTQFSDANGKLVSIEKLEELISK